jgi:hypothetical protein
MRTLRTIVSAIAAAGVLAAVGTASAADGSHGVFFVHGTGSNTPPSSNHGFRSTNDGTAVTSYWTTDVLNAWATNPADGTQYSYGVAGYDLSGNMAQDSAAWGKVVDQLWDYYMYGNGGAIYHVVVVTHSNGSNALRYAQAHPTAVTPGGHAASDVLSHVERIIYSAGDNGGTPLADKVTTSGTFANIANDVVSWLLPSMNYNSRAVVQQVQANMQTYNGNGTYKTGTSPGGPATYYLYGTGVNAAIWSSDAWCGGYAASVGLKAAQVYGWGSSSATTDGFIGTVNYNDPVTAQNVSSKMAGINGMPGATGDTKLSHNQDRRNCRGFQGTVKTNIHGAMSGTFTAPPTDYTVSPAAQACNEVWQGWITESDGYDYSPGCTSTMQSNSSTDYMCEVSYGSDNGSSFPTDFASSTYGNAANYANGGTGCSDSWLGDGTCDLCLVAKYGYDSSSGSAADDDCVNAGVGTTNICYDIFSYNSSTTSLTGSSLRYHGYAANH